MLRVLPTVAQHRLNLQKDCRLIRKRLNRFHPAHREVIKQEVDKFLAIGFIKEIQYPEWLSNVVVVPKKNGKWRVCVDYTNLNDACPKDTFPLPWIDQIVEATAGHELLSFLDAYSGYNQIPMHLPNSTKIAFITSYGMYCCNVMPFGLMNARATYQRMKSPCVQAFVGKDRGGILDDILVKSKSRGDHLGHL